MTLVTANVTWLWWLLENFGVSVSMPTLLSAITGVINIARDPLKHEFTKHIDVDTHFTRLQIQNGVIALQYVHSEF
jgi:hypothetical protein